MPDPALAADTDRTLTLERVIDAPRALVFQAFSDPAHLPHWFGPAGFTCRTRAIDIRPGGCWDFVMHGPDGTDYENFHRYLEVSAPERMVYDVGERADGPVHFRTTVTFADEGVRTRVRMRSVFPSAEACEAVQAFGAVELGHQTLAKLAERVAGMGLRFTRVIDAPRERVYRAWTDAEQLAAWWGPAGMAIEVQRADIRPGGVFHYRMVHEHGEMWGKFRYVALDAPERIVFFNAFSNAAGETVRSPFSEDFPLEILNVVTFTERPDGKTLLEMGGGPLATTEAERAFYASLGESMQQGFSGTFDQLDAYLAAAG